VNKNTSKIITHKYEKKSSSGFEPINIKTGGSDYFPGGELDIASCRYGRLEIAILHGDLELITN
jgi:hypothetical protein